VWVRTLSAVPRSLLGASVRRVSGGHRVLCVGRRDGDRGDHTRARESAKARRAFRQTLLAAERFDVSRKRLLAAAALCELAVQPGELLGVRVDLVLELVQV